jgi:hypothetical protein
MNRHESRTLQAKLQQFTDGLTSEEHAELRAARTDDVTGMLSPSLRAKARQAADALTPEEKAHLSRLLRRAGAAADADADTQGYMKAVYEDGLGYKGRPGTPGGENTPQPAGSNMNLGQVLIGAATVVGGMVGAGYGEPYPQ